MFTSSETFLGKNMMYFNEMEMESKDEICKTVEIIHIDEQWV